MVTDSYRLDSTILNPCLIKTCDACIQSSSDSSRCLADIFHILGRDGSRDGSRDGCRDGCRDGGACSAAATACITGFACSCIVVGDPIALTEVVMSLCFTDLIPSASKLLSSSNRDAHPDRVSSDVGFLRASSRPSIEIPPRLITRRSYAGLGLI